MVSAEGRCPQTPPFSPEKEIIINHGSVLTSSCCVAIKLSVLHFKFQIPNVSLKFGEMCVKILHKTSRIFPRYVILLDSMVKMKVKGSVLKFSYPMSLPVLCPCAICQLLSESLHLLAAAHFVTGPHFTLKPAGGRQVPPQH